MSTIWVILSDLKLFLWQKNVKKVWKNWILTFRNPVKNPIFNFFEFFLLHSHRGIILDRLEKTRHLYLVSFHLISKKPQKPPNSRENRGNLENWPIEKVLTPIFVISAKKWLRKVYFHTCTMPDPQKSCPVLY